MKTKPRQIWTEKREVQGIFEPNRAVGTGSGSGSGSGSGLFACAEHLRVYESFGVLRIRLMHRLWLEGFRCSAGFGQETRNVGQGSMSFSSRSQSLLKMSAQVRLPERLQD